MNAAEDAVAPSRSARGNAISMAAIFRHQMQAVARALSSGVDHVYRRLLHSSEFHTFPLFRERSVSGIMILASMMVAGAVMITAVSR